MKDNKIDINKTKYRYLMDNLKLFPIRPIITYTIPVPKDPSVDESKQEFFDRRYPDVKITNLHFKHMIDKTAKALVAYGVKKGDIVTICHTNTPEMFYMDYALSKIGAKANFIYPNVTAEEMKYYMNELDSKYMFILDDEFIRKNVKKATYGTGIKIISSTPIESFPEIFKMVAAKKNPVTERTVLENEITWNEFIDKGKKIKVVQENAYTPNEVCSYIHTSGTTSTPKAVMITNENDNQVVRNDMYDGIVYDKNDAVLQTIPHFVQYGKSTDHATFCNNVLMIIIPEMEPRNFYDLIKKYKPEYSYTTPSHARELIKRPVDMSNTKNFLFGGDRFHTVEKELIEYFKINGSKSVPYQGYGLTEFSAKDIVNRPKAYRENSLGKLCGDTRAIIVEPGTFNVINKSNVIGELCFTGPGLTMGYAGESAKENKNVFVKHPDNNIYVHTGDLISVDEDGFYYYHGRMKNIIFRNSFKIPPDDVASYVMENKNVKDCVVIPKYSVTEGETPSVHMTLYDYSIMKETMSEISERINTSSSVNPTYCPTDYKIRKNLVVSRNNKIDITALRIEDTASMFYGVVNATISLLKNGEYDYALDIEMIPDNGYQTEEDLIRELDNHINLIAESIKFKVGKIKYNIKYVDISYSDKLDMSIDDFTYVKHM